MDILLLERLAPEALPRKVVVTRDFLDFAPVLRAIARLHGGTDNTDLEACCEQRIRVIQGTHAHVRSNAECFDAPASGPAPLESRSGPIDTDPAGLSPGA